MATTVAPVAAYTHKAPVMPCAPGSTQDPKTSFGGYGDSIDSIVPWPGGSQIRFATLSNDAVPSWFCVGARARLYDQSKPTMNFNFGGWKDSKAVCSHAYIKRLAAHLFGHALEL
ncbi:ATP synthase subunits region orf 7 [Fusarium oxysporum f. sp. phaseoli]